MALLIGGIANFFFGFMLFVTSIFLILLVLVQRGRGGGLTGALGGAGGQSAFGTKAGDVFTRITAICALVWFLLCVGAIVSLQRNTIALPGTSGVSATDPGDGEDAKDGDAKDGDAKDGDAKDGDADKDADAEKAADAAAKAPADDADAEKAPAKDATDTPDPPAEAPEESKK